MRYFKINSHRLFEDDYSDTAEWFVETDETDDKEILLAIVKRSGYDCYKNIEIEKFYLTPFVTIYDYREAVNKGLIPTKNKLKLYKNERFYNIFSVEECGDVKYYLETIVEEIHIKKLEVES